MARKLIYLPIEVKARELDAKLLLAYYAVFAGFDIIIGDMPTIYTLSETNQKGIVFFKGGPHGFRERMITHSYEFGHQIVELDEEGFLFQPTLYLQDRMQKKSLDMVTQEYCWGQNQFDTIVGAYPQSKDKVFVTGNPRFDLLSPKYRQLYKEDSNQLIDKYGDFILINTRFSIYNTAKGFKKTVHFKHIEQLYIEFIKMIKQLASELPNQTIIVRPHPGENRQSYQKELHTFQNVKIIHEGSLVPWLNAAKVVIHNGCTSGVEAYLLDKLVIAYVPFETKEAQLPNVLSNQATTVEEVIQLLKDSHKRNDDILHNHYKIENDTHAYTEIISLLEKVDTVSYQERLRINKFPVVKRKKSKRIFSLTENEIAMFFHRLNEIDNKKQIIDIHEICSNVYYLSLE
ncbi:surface carbohydrate biosynthesis protein [Gracilibacillus marinus]|jgi:surface carbohydrate biosynthesis protein|uniref:Surface carbohydrate biosynthesis protein n=1 Tax=Gracilibacillus marinus TaxID=630535 RepID=A0ABV8VZ83_9BACI